ncbi:MAG: C45 family autoproteolytic acyltransferase/hydrolase, partial [Promethearchaeota archaeon]
LPYIPSEYKEELLGLSEGATAGSGFHITFDDVLAQNLFLEILYGQKFMDAGGGCTCFGIVNSDNTTTIGQNIDLYQIMGWYSSFVLHKLANEPLIFSYRLGAGMIPSLKSENNLTVVINLVELSQKAPICTPLFVLLREALTNTNNVLDFYNVINNTNMSPYGINYIISDSKEILAAQFTRYNQTWSMPTNIVHSNTFLDPYWQNELKDPNYSKERQIYAESLLSSAFTDSKLTLSELHVILSDFPIICRDEGGLLSSETIAFMTSSTFGIGNTNTNIGYIPI